MSGPKTEDEAAYEAEERRRWLEKAPKQRDWDAPPMSDDEAAYHNHEVQEWFKQMPRTNDDWDRR